VIEKLFFWRKSSKHAEADHLSAVIADLEFIQSAKINDHPWLKGVDPTQSLEGKALDKFYQNFFETHKDSMFGYEDYKEFRAGVEGVFGDKPFSRYEVPQVHAWLTSMQRSIDEACDRTGVQPRKKPIFGTLQTGRVQGMAVDLDNPEYYLILLDDGIMGFANLFAKVVAMLFEVMPNHTGRAEFSSDLDNMIKLIKNNDEISHRFFDLVTAYVIYGAPHAAKPYLLAGEQQYITGVVRDSMEYFIFGHEYGHCSAGHLEEGQRKLLRMSQLGKASEHKEMRSIIPENWEDEHEADSIGLLLAMDIMTNKGVDIPLSFLGIDQVFVCIHILERAIDVLEYGEVKQRVLDTHPPSPLRQAVLREMLKNGTPDEVYKGTIQLADTVAVAMELLWSGTEAAMVAMHKNGIRPNERWRPSGFQDERAGSQGA